MNDEEKLASELRSGSAAALERIIDVYAAYVCTVLRNFSRGALTAEDVDELCADVFGKLWERRSSIDPAVGLRAYLSASARNAVKNRFRSLKPPSDDISELELDSGFSVEEEAELHELIGCLNAGIDELDSGEREIFLRFYFYGEKTADIAKITKNSEGTVRSKLSRTRRKLKKYLEERGFDHA